MDASVDRKDPRYEALVHGHNLRFPESAAVAPARIVICTTSAQVKKALQDAIHEGIRPTVRSGGHCYENFTVNNPGGVLLDLSLLNAVRRDPATGEYCVLPGAVLGDIYQALYKRDGVTLPGGNCYSVGAGGHISGGGYGELSRLHGLTCDWVSAIDILTVDSLGRVIERRVDRKDDPDLFRACRGAGTAGFGVITAFYFQQLPPAPREVSKVYLNFPWEAMSEDQFVSLLTTYGDYWTTRGCDPETWGLFAILDIGSRSNGRLGMSIQFCQPDGTAKDLSVLREFLARFEKFRPSSRLRGMGGTSAVKQAGQRSSVELGLMSWLAAATADRSGNIGERAKYKSAYMKRNFVAAEAQTIYRFYSGNSIAARSSVIAVDSYGGAANRRGLDEETAVAQRASIMKLQWMCFWTDPAKDAQLLSALDAFYTGIYSGKHVDVDHQGTPWGDAYEGCYMNYPDSDMLRYAYWPELYYGQRGLYPFLQKVKQTYDPNNVFHHAMSVRPSSTAG
jgi:FAD/FMN-containing dehydrogenase